MRTSQSTYSKLERVSAKVNACGCSAFISFDTAENFYLTGFKASFGITVLKSDGKLLFLTDGRYLENAKERLKECAEVIEWKGWEEFSELLKKEQLERICVDTSRLKTSTFMKLKKTAEITQTEGFLSEFRSIKSEEELIRITKAVQIAELALKSILHILKPGITELEFRRELISAFFRFGGEGEAFTTIVASGKSSAVPHWETSKAEIKDGSLVIVDFGTVCEGYVSDITRTFLVGNVPYEAKEIYTVVKEAQELGIKELKAGTPCRTVDWKVRDFISEKGYGEYFLHSTGHGIGIEVHEAPTVSKKSEEILKQNMTVTVEPGIYIPDLGGVRIEDDCLVTDSGGIPISSLDK